MNAKQTKLIEQAATVETDGEGWRKRMEAWLDAKREAHIDEMLCGIANWTNATIG